ncbi:hypothetical protein LTR64_001860 [Lithohypha guttulata]|uniref:UspA domain-containing protein n=1 Tax=Lithohypha guttulata TaxID=1690604 RepID=A0AAN7Y8U7_9EURO|nr:hypothetical protein LTR51_007719 [Lithohypha guttulata]KAK5081703.1 hypothetical protein LTR05_007836 [Lithohypha guttulata]
MTSLQQNNPTLASAAATMDGPRTKEEQEELAFGQVWDGAGKPSSTTGPGQMERPSMTGRRKSSIQFNTGAAEETIRRESTCPPIPRPSLSQAHLHRNSSPPPALPYSRGVGFDTFATPDAAAEAFSIQYKHNDFQYTPRTRTFICGTDAKDYSEYALEWTLDELVDDGDEIVCLRVVSEESSERREYKKEAERLLASVIQKNAIERKAISLKMELAVGRVTEVIQSMIQLYEPVAIIVGTRGRNLTGMQGLMGGSSVSKYCLQRSPVPTIVVRPTLKRTKKKTKRQAEQGRSVYTNMLTLTKSVGGQHISDRSFDAADFATKGTSEEANAVEKAVGPRKGILRNKGRVYGGPLTRVTSTSQTEDDDIEDPQSRFALPIGFLTTESAPKADIAMKSPIIQALAEWDDSPRNGSRTASPARHAKPESEGALTDTEDEGEFGMPKIVEERRPSTRSQNPWLNSILSRPEPRRRSVSRERGARSSSR